MISYPHTVLVQRESSSATLEDEYGRAESTGEETVDTLDAWVQAKSSREQAAFAESGAGVSTHTIFLYDPDRVVRASHVLETEEGGGQPAGDRHNIVGEPRDPDGTGHHLEVDTLLVHRVAT